MRTFITLAICLAANSMGALTAARGVDYLVPGLGVARVLEIGQRVTDRSAGENGWVDAEHGLQYKVNQSGNVVLIRCEQSGCATDRNVGVGMTKGVVLQRYGAPVSKREMGEGVFYQYQGVGFAIEGDVVKGIYILPR